MPHTARVLILHEQVPPGARADERDVLVQVDAVRAVLERAETLACTLDLSEAARRIRASHADVVFNLVESLGGQGRLVHLAPALLDAIGVPYTGGGTEALFCTSHKLLAKRLLRAAGLPTPDWFDPRTDGGAAAGGFVPGVYLVKSVWEEASLGIDDESLIRAVRPEDLLEACRSRAPRLGGSAFAERFIDGREFNVSVIAREGAPCVLPPAEIRFDAFPAGKPRLVGYAAKWDAQSFEYQNTPRSFAFEPRDEPLLGRLRELSRRVWAVLGLDGYARVDFRVDSEGRPLVLEVNVNPCLSPDAGFAAAAKQAGLELADVVRLLVDDAQRRGSASRSLTK